MAPATDHETEITVVAAAGAAIVAVVAAVFWEKIAMWLLFAAIWFFQTVEI